MTQVPKDKNTQVLTAQQIYLRTYYLTHKEQSYKKTTQYREDHPEQIAAYKKEWAKNHEEHLCKYNHQYYLENIVKIKEFQNTPYECECGGRYTRRNRAMHMKSNKHIASLEIDKIL